MNDELKEFKKYITVESGEMADAYLVQKTRQAMTEKLEKKRDEGQHGWWTCPNDRLFDMAMEHLERSKEDPGQLIDVINFLAMIMVKNNMEHKTE